MNSKYFNALLLAGCGLAVVAFALIVVLTV